MSNQAALCLFSIAAREIIDRTYDGVEGVYLMESVETLKEQYPDLRVGTYADASAALESGYVSDPEETTEACFDCAFHGQINRDTASPAMHWTHDGYTETFKVAERYEGNITEIYCRIGERYFVMRDRASLTHQEIIAKVRRVISAQDFDKRFLYFINADALCAKADLAELAADLVRPVDPVAAEEFEQRARDFDQINNAQPLPIHAIFNRLDTDSRLNPRAVA